MTDDQSEDLLDHLVESGTLAPEEAAYVAATTRGADSVRTLLDRGLVDRDQIETALDRIAARRGGPARAPAARPARLPLVHAPREIDQTDSWRTPLVGGALALAPADRPSEPGRYSLGARTRLEPGREVFAATDLVLVREVELHFPAPGSPPGAFETAYRLHAAIAGRGSARVLDRGVDPGGRPYFVLPAAPAGTLEAALLELAPGGAGELAPGGAADRRRELLRALGAACRIVQAAHAAGVFHLALSPAAIRLGRQGQVVVTGWGASEVGTRNAERGTNKRPRRAGSSAEWDGRRLGGAPEARDPYRAPELDHARGASPASDVYSLGRLAADLAWGPGAPPEVPAIVKRATAPPILTLPA